MGDKDRHRQRKTDKERQSKKDTDKQRKTDRDTERQTKACLFAHLNEVQQRLDPNPKPKNGKHNCVSLELHFTNHKHFIHIKLYSAGAVAIFG